MIKQSKDVQKKLEYSFRDESMLELALTHRSAGPNNNERLEFLGDAVLQLAVTELLYAEFPNDDEGRLSRLRANLVKRETLALIGRELDLGQYLSLGVGEMKSGGHSRDSTLADAVEAILGAIFLDSGYLGAKEIVRKLIVPLIDTLPARGTEKDPKTRLQEYVQGLGKPLPEYEVIHTFGEAHSRMFEVACTVAGISEPTSGKGSSRRRAEQSAAETALEKLRQ